MKHSPTKKKSNSIFLLHNLVTPYRLPLFEELNKTFNLHVFFGEFKSPDRKWSVSMKGYTFESMVLPHLRIGSFVINYTIIKELLFRKYDAYLVAENEENVFSIMLIFIFAKTYRKPFIIWSEHVERPEMFNELVMRKAKHKNLHKIYLWLFNTYRVFMYKFTNAFASFSGTYSDKFLLNRNVKKEKIFTSTQIMPKGLFFDNARNINKKLKFEDKRIVLYLGYIRDAKGIELLIKAFDEINNDDYLLQIVGDGEKKNMYIKKYSKNKNIIFHDYADGIKKVNYFKNASVFVLPSYYDCWAMVTNESLYYGTPVIISDAVASSQLIEDGKHGYIVKTGDYMDLKNILEKLMKNDHLVREMRENVENYPKSKLTDINRGVGHIVNAINFSLNK